MSGRASDRWLSIALAVVTHALIVALLIGAYWRYKRPAPPLQQLAIEATVVDASQLPAGTLPSKAPPVEQASPEPVSEPLAEPPPEPKPEVKPEPAPEPEPKAKPEVRKAPDNTAQKAAQRKAAEQRAKAESEAKLKAAADKAAKEKAAREKAEQDKADKEKADKAKQEAERLAREKAAADRQKAQTEADLRSRMAAEEHFAAAKASGLLAQYQAQIRARIEQAWNRPPTAKPGLSCEVHITQVPGGEVTGVQVGSCNGDDAVRQSIEAAALRASPLPLPPDPALFDRNLVVTFKPQD